MSDASTYSFSVRCKQHAARLARVAVASSMIALAACATPQGQQALETTGRGIVGLVLSPFMIVAGIAQGLAFLPYTIGTGLVELNKALVNAQAVSLNDAYKATYGVGIADQRVDQRTGEVAGESYGFGRHRPEAMLDATHSFQRLLVSQGMPEAKARHYLLTGDYTQTRTRGHLLVAVVYRQSGMEPFRVVSKQTGIATTFRTEDRGWREAYARDIDGRPLDEVIDWVGLDYASLQQDKTVAMLMVLAAESVKKDKRAPDYWQAERRWAAGDSAQVISESSAKVKRALPAA